MMQLRRRTAAITLMTIRSFLDPPKKKMEAANLVRVICIRRIKTIYTN